MLSNCGEVLEDQLRLSKFTVEYMMARRVKGSTEVVLESLLQVEVLSEDSTNHSLSQLFFLDRHLRSGELRLENHARLGFRVMLVRGVGGFGRGEHQPTYPVPLSQGLRYPKSEKAQHEGVESFHLTLKRSVDRLVQDQ